MSEDVTSLIDALTSDKSRDGVVTSMASPSLTLNSTSPREEARIRVMELEHRETTILKQISKDADDNKIFHFKRPNPPQKILLDAYQDQNLKVFTFTGGNRSGKTTIGALLALSTLFGFYPWSGEKILFPHRKPRKVRLVGQDWEKHITQVVVPALHTWWPKSRPLSTKKNNMGADAFWTDMLTGSTLEIMSNRQESELHEGWDGDLVVYDEPPRRDIRIANTRGLVDRNGRELFCMTLLKEAWVDQEVIKARNEDGTPDLTVFNVHAEIFDNVGYGLTQEAVDLFAKKLNPEEKEARLRGIPSYMSGLILPQFNRQLHIHKTGFKKIPLDWIIDLHIDFHPSKQWAVLFMATGNHGFKYCIDEIWEHGSWKSIGEDIVRRLRKWDCRVNHILIDPLAKGNANTDLDEESVFDKLYNLFAGYGYTLSVASKDKASGIEIVKNLLMTENELPAIFFLSHLKKTIMEIEGWMYDENGKPQKKDDDFVEGLYRLALLDTQYESMNEVEEADNIRPTHQYQTCTGY